MASDFQILMYFTNNPEQIVGGDPLCLHIEDTDEREKMITAAVKLFEARVSYLPNGDAMIITGLN